MSQQSEVVKNARLDLDNQKRKLANSHDAEKKAHYQEKVPPLCTKEKNLGRQVRPSQPVGPLCCHQVTKAEETLETELDYQRRLLQSVLDEEEEILIQRAAVPNPHERAHVLSAILTPSVLGACPRGSSCP